ncbi:MAG: hypothetical protein EHM33_00930 [Chloroflexi bacterium]|nr:MAG: hypothetical protein EHM33_00930 [Chloroflexota bacterium]
MTLLTDAPPETITIDGEAYRVRTDFRDCIRVLTACEAPDLTQLEKVYRVVLGYFYIDTPTNTEEALKQAQIFLNGGKTHEGDSGPRTFDFQKDAEAIYAAFRQTHGIDLTTAPLHWWQFLALMRGLDNESDFRQLVGLRYRLKTSKATKEERAAAREIRDLIDIEDPDDRTLEEREAEELFYKLISQGQNKNG